MHCTNPTGYFLAYEIEFDYFQKVERKRKELEHAQRSMDNLLSSLADKLSDKQLENLKRKLVETQKLTTNGWALIRCLKSSIEALRIAENDYKKLDQEVLHIKNHIIDLRKEWVKAYKEAYCVCMGRKKIIENQKSSIISTLTACQTKHQEIRLLLQFIENFSHAKSSRNTSIFLSQHRIFRPIVYSSNPRDSSISPSLKK